MNTLAELPSTLAVTSLIAVAITGCVACWMVAIVAKAPDRTELAACLREVAGVIRAIWRGRP